MFRRATQTSLLTVLLLGSIQSALPASGDGGWWGDLFDEDKIISLNDVLKEPMSYRGKTVTFIAQFHKLGKIDNPFYTKFESEWYLNFSIWADEAPLWTRKGYREDFQYIFIRRNAKLASKILHAPLYARFVFVVEVSDIFKGKPWMEVTGLTQLDAQMNESSLIHMVKGFTLKRVGRHAAAAREFAAADHKTLPLHVRLKLMMEEAGAWAADGKKENAARALRLAAGLVPEDAEIRKTIAALTRRLGLETTNPEDKGSEAARSKKKADGKKESEASDN